MSLSELINGGTHEILNVSTLFFLEARLALVQAGASTATGKEIISQMGISMNTIENLNVAMLSKIFNS